MELKDMTLKELGNNWMRVDKRTGKAIFREDLIDWAIAKVKELRNEESDYISSAEGGEVSTKDLHEAIEHWIMHNFNLTEDDLK